MDPKRFRIRYSSLGGMAWFSTVIALTLSSACAHSEDIPAPRADRPVGTKVADPTTEAVVKPPTTAEIDSSFSVSEEELASDLITIQRKLNVDYPSLVDLEKRGKLDKTGADQLIQCREELLAAKSRRMEGKAVESLKTALEKNDEKAVRDLIKDKKVSPAWRIYDPGGKFHDVPIFLWAAQKAPLPLIKVMVELGADPVKITSTTTGSPLNALCFAALLGRTDVVEYLLTFKKIEKNTALAVVCITRVRSVKASQYTDTAKALLKEGADPEAKCQICRAEKDKPKPTTMEASEQMLKVLEMAYKRGEEGVRLEDLKLQGELIDQLKAAIRDRRR